jgi:hypothetical protein
LRSLFADLLLVFSLVRAPTPLRRHTPVPYARLCVQLGPKLLVATSKANTAISTAADLLKAREERTMKVPACLLSITVDIRHECLWQGVAKGAVCGVYSVGFRVSL